jgi:cytochrome c oxidase assembly protein subunit 15
MPATTANARTPNYKPGLALFAGIGSVWVFVLVTLGAFTTTIGAGMVFSDWPLSNGSVNPHGWVTNVAMFAEHSHRLSGTTMGLITIVLAIWLHRTESRRWLRQLGWWALAIVVVQGLLGGTRVLLDRVSVPGFQMSLGQMLRIPHGVLAQIYVCVLIAIAVSCSRGWITRAVPVKPRVRTFGLILCAVLLVQLTVAAVMRHNGAGLAISTFPHSTDDGRWLPASWNFPVAIHFTHRVLASLLAIFVPVFVFLVRRDPASTLSMRAAASALLSLILLQILLGAEIILTGRQVDMTTGHVVVGAMTLATAFWLTWVAHRDTIQSRE